MRNHILIFLSLFLFTQFIYSQIPSAGMKLWLKADDGAYTDLFTTSATDSTLVRVWADRSGSDNHFMQPDPNNRPAMIEGVLCGKPVLRFDVSRRTFLYNSMRISGPKSIFIVFVKTPMSNEAGDLLSIKGNANEFTEVVVTDFSGYRPLTFIADLPSTTTGSFFQNSSGFNAAFSARGNLLHVSYNGGTITNPSSYNASYDSISVSASGGGLLGRYSQDSTSIGGRAPYQNINFLKGDIAEIIVYDRVLSSGEINDVTDYLIYKYGLLGNCVLPVRLYSFNATLLGKRVHLSWKTADEAETIYYEIQRSADGLAWHSIGRINASGLNDTQYSFFDNNPYTGRSYYRIAAVDRRERILYSTTRKVDNSFAAFPFVRLYPNPAADFFSIDAQNDETFLITVTGVNGQLMKKENVSSGQKINISGLSPGIYRVNIMGRQTNINYKLIKQ